MRIIANENIAATVVNELRIRGHDVVWIRESSPRLEDSAILEQAQLDSRLVLTHDKDFGELAFRYGLPASCGVVLIRLSGHGPQADIEQVLRVIDGRDDWVGHFSVVSRGRVRMRPLPETGGHRKPK